VGRFARTHAPFTTSDAALYLGLPDAVVLEVLSRLEAAGRVASGTYRPGGNDREWVDTEVLRRLKRRSLAVLRNEVAAVEPEALGRFLPQWHGVGDTSARPGRLIEIVRRLQGVALPASVLEPDVLSSRMAYAPSMLDDLLASGEVVWMGREPLGRGDGRLAVYLRDQVPLLWWPPNTEAPSGEIHDRLRQHLADRGASFWRDLYAAAEGGDPQQVLDALWDLVWAGEVTNDTMAPLRAFLGKRRRRSGRSRSLTSATPAAATGRWYLVTDLLPTVPPSPEEIAKARAEQLLERHGIVTRDAVLAEGSPGGFAGLYPVFGAMEDAGRVRRGYFIEGLGGAQFATPGAVDRLRLADETGVTVMAATDPANPFGAAAPWPSDRFGARRAGAYVVLIDGTLGAYVERGGRSLTIHPDADPAAIASGLAQLARSSMPRLTIESIDGEPATGSSLLPHLTAEGFTPGYKGLSLRRRVPRA
ncbi:MAG: DEAD/DEAH box helicase, partial [Acidimicrobiia bacterium]|nr:DEAD/DEAH box helicase [Acidimicrobiia bacterium]